jgi:hypothetical protein
LLAAEVTWVDVLSAVGAVSTPFAVAAIGFLLSRQLKRIEAQQWRSQELIAARLRYYREIAEPLNDLMCYFTFIGMWKKWTPPEIIDFKRTLDRTFHTLAPFFSVDVVRAYGSFMDLCFEVFGEWGADARLKTSFRRRREAAGEEWRSEWEFMFSYSVDDSPPPERLEEIKASYNEVLARLVGDIQLTIARTDYATASVVLNA